MHPSTPNASEINDLVDLTAKILLRCFLLGYLLLLLWAAVMVLAPGIIHGFDQTFDLTAHEVNVINYCGIAFVKCCVLIFFFFPYVSIRLVMRKRRG